VPGGEPSAAHDRLKERNGVADTAIDVFSLRHGNRASVTVSPLPAPVRAPRELDVWVPLSDGARLAARLWLPPDADSDPVPAIVEVSPYRHEDHTRRRDSVRHPYFAEHGFASLRVDIRGSGASDGVLPDEYSEQERRDVCEALAWVAEQPWCSGSVGMIGISWGGFAALQAAAERPPALKAIVVACASGDRYGGDVKYQGGALLACELVPWSSTMLAMSARPPDPALAGAGWRELWLERLEAATPFAETWLAHQRRDAYWRSGSPCEDYGAIECPVYAVGGWADPYRGAVLDLLASLDCPRKGLIGPWSHQYPEEGKPGPGIDFRRECVRWWEHWLKGVDTGIMEEPGLTVWMQEPPGFKELAGRPRGHWVAEAAWPSPQVSVSTLFFGDRTLGAVEAPPVELRVESRERCGAAAGAWCPWDDRELPADQTPDDELGLSFTTGPLANRLELLGSPVLVARLSANRATASLAVRLCDVAPDGVSTLISIGLLNLAHRSGSVEPKPMKPGRPESVRVPLEAVAYALPPGHRLRISLSPTYWPWVWPSPDPVELTFWTASGRLELPVRDPGAEACEPPRFEAPPALTEPNLCECERTASSDPGTGRSEVLVRRERGQRRVREDGTEVGGSQTDRFSIVEGDPLSARIECRRTMTMSRGSWAARVETSSTMTADRETFVLVNLVEAFENGERIYSRERSASIPRDFV
jgi:putative CocE/NonD family hydrolase